MGFGELFGSQKRERKFEEANLKRNDRDAEGVKSADFVDDNYQHLTGPKV